MASRLVRMSSLDLPVSPLLERCTSMETYMVRVYVGSLNANTEFVSIEAVKNSVADDIVKGTVFKLGLSAWDNYELAETFCSGGQICKERRLESSECPVKIQTLWPKVSPYIAERHRTEYRFFLCKKEPERQKGLWMEYSEPNPVDSFLTTFLQQSIKKKEYTDLCNLPNLNESTLLDNLKRRFQDGNIYTYVGSILISLNPFKFYPIYNPKYIKMYQNRRLGELPPHIFAIADAAYHTMLHQKRNQCIVISGESGSGKTESTNLLLHHLSALSQKGYYSNGIEQTILGAGPVLEAFGNAKTVHNNNSSRFGKFIQVNYKENGVVHGAVVEKYLLEKSRIVSQSKNERNYHVFYYLLSGGSTFEHETLGLQEPQDYFYLNQSECYTLENLEGECVDEAYELTRLQQSMDMVGFSTDTQRRIFSVLAAVLHLGNVSFKKKTDHAHHEAVQVENIQLVNLISSLLKVKEATMLEALTKRKTMAGGESVVMNYKMPEALATRDAMAKCLYGALFDWIVMQINHAILAKRDYKEHQGYSIGVLDIFGFEDFEKNSFEQFCINYANEHLHYYFNQHIFKFEQEEYMREGIQWKNIEFMDNTGCLDLFSSRPFGLLCLLDEECNFPGATNETLLAKFHSQHTSNPYYEEPQMKQSAFTINHYAGRVKYHIEDFREKNSDLMRNDIVLLLKNSNLAFVRELVGYDPVAVLRWAILRAFFRAFFAFKNAGKQHQKASNSSPKSANIQLAKTSAATNTMSRMGSVKKLKAQWDQHLPEDTGGSGDVSNQHRPLARRPAVTSQTRLDQALQRRKAFKSTSIKGSNSAPSSPSVMPTVPGSFISSSMDTDPQLDNDANLINLDQSNQSETSKVATDQDESCEDVSLDLSRSCDHMDTSNGECKKLQGGEDKLIMKRASKVLMKNRSFRPRTRTTKLRDLKVMKTLAGKRALGPRPSKGKNKPPSVSTQFNFSLQQLMESLSHANPFFIRCIKSNFEKAPCVFDNDIVLRQLRYTGMLATVKIRQSGYNYRLTTEEFVQQYKVLLPRGLLSSRDDIHMFLTQCDQNQENFQIGTSKIFLRETDKLVLDEMLHRAIMQRVMSIQSWLKTRLERKRYIKMRSACIIIQCTVRRFLAQRHVRLLRQIYATIMIQRMFRGFKQRKAFRDQRRAALTIQKHVRGHMARREYALVKSSLPAVHIPYEADSSAALVNQDLPPLSPHPTPPLAKFRQKSGADIADGRSNICDKINLAAKTLPREPCDMSSDSLDVVARIRDRSKSENDAKSDLDLPVIVSRKSEPENHVERGHDETDMVYSDSLRSKGQCKRVINRSSDDKFHDIYSSASDEGILSKELSSEEYLADKTDVTKGLESEGSSGILDDSESEGILYTSRHKTPKARTRSVASLPSTLPTSPFTTTPPSITSTPASKRDRVPSMPFEDIMDFQYPSCLRRANSNQVPDKPRAHSVAVLQTRPQQPGPKDLELHVGPVTKAVSEEFLQTYETSSNYRISSMPTPHLTAPIAKPEPFSEFEDSLLVSSPAMKKKQTSLSSLLPGDSTSLSSQGGIANKSPFYKARRQIKQFVTAAHMEVKTAQKTAQKEFTSVVSEFPTLHRQWTSESLHLHRQQHSDSSGLTSPESPGKPFCPSSHKASDLFKQSKLSIKHMLKQSGKKKKDNTAYDSDDSQGEDTQSITSQQSGILKPKEAWRDDENSTGKPKLRRRNSKKKRPHKEKESKTTMVHVTSTSSVTSWTVSGTSQWQYPTVKVVNSFYELRQLEDFVCNKLLVLQKGVVRETVFDHVFKLSLKEFQNNLITRISFAQQQNKASLSYREIMSSFEEILKAHTKAEKTDEEFPVTVGINAFRGFLDEFCKKKENRELPEIKIKKEKKKKDKDKDKETYVEHNGHRYEQAQFSIHTYCELCSSHIWLLEKAFVCQVCRYTVHRKCYSKSSTKCSWFRGAANQGDDKVFGVPLHALVSAADPIPPIIERLLSLTELNWIYTEGLYRKGGAAAKIRDLIKEINADPDNVELSDYHAHVITSVIKRFLGDMPEPLFTYDSYDDIIMATEITDERERVQSLYSIMEKLPQSHHDLLERLMVHLAKVAMNEEYNKMSATGLAIIFAPSILKTDRPQTAQASLNVVSKTSMCVQIIIEEQMCKLRHVLDDISTLDTAAASATNRLLRVRASIQAHDMKLTEATVSCESVEDDDEEQMLSEQIAMIQHRKQTLTNQLTVLNTHWSSSEEDLLSTDEVETPKDLDNFEEYAVSFDYPASSNKQLHHLNKRRAPLPRRQIPTPIKRNGQRSRTMDSGTDDDDSDVPTRKSLVPPTLSTIGTEIIV